MLGACLIDVGTIEQVAQILQTADFYRPHHATIYAAIISMWAGGEPIDALTVMTQLADAGDLQRVGGAPYLHRLVAETPMAASATHYARTVAERSQRRRLSELAAAIERSADVDSVETRRSLLATAYARLTEIVDGRVGRDPVQRLLDDLLDTVDLDSLAPLDPLVRGVLYRDSLAWLAGRPGRGKTLVALDIAGSVGTGTPWQGFQVARGDVWYVIAEGIRGLRDRVRAWEHLAQRPMTGVRFLPYPVQAGDDAAWRAFCRAAKRKHPDLIVLDTQARVSVGLDENDGRDMGQLVERLEELRVASTACVLTLHHTPRNGDHVRGHSAIEGAAQTIIMVTKDGDVLTLNNTDDKGGKQKDGAPFDPVHLRIHPVATGGVDSVALAYTDRAAPSVEISSAGCREMLTTWWERQGDEWVSPTMLAESGISKTVFYTYKRKLIDVGLVEVEGKEGKGQRPRYRLPKDPGEE